MIAVPRPRTLLLVLFEPDVCPEHIAALIARMQELEEFDECSVRGLHVADYEVPLLSFGVASRRLIDGVWPRIAATLAEAPFRQFYQPEVRPKKRSAKNRTFGLPRNSCAPMRPPHTPKARFGRPMRPHGRKFKTHRVMHS